MVYTVTFNPSLDYIVEVKSFELGMTNRTSYEHMLPGGKGINVSIVLNNLEFDTTAFGFVAGFTGKQICDMVSEYGINTDFIQIDNGFSRINMKIKNIDGTEINGILQLPIVLILLSSTFLPLGQEVSPAQRARSIQIFYCFQPLLKTESYLRFTISNSFLT